MVNSKWVNNAEGNWIILSKSPLVYRADDDKCKITISKDNELLRTLTFKKNSVVSYTVTPNATGNTIGMHWEPADSLISSIDHSPNAISSSYYHPQIHAIIENMNNHFHEANQCLESLKKNPPLPISVKEIFKSVQGSVAFSKIMIHLYVNAANKKGQDDFTQIIKDSETNSAQNAYKSIMFFTVVSGLSAFVFMVENLFKRILEDKEITPLFGLEKLTVQISDLASLSKKEHEIFCVLREMRNSFHGNMKFDGKKELHVVLDDYVFDFKKGKSTIHQFDYVSKIILESSKNIKTLLEKIYPI